MCQALRGPNTLFKILSKCTFVFLFHRRYPRDLRHKGGDITCARSQRWSVREQRPSTSLLCPTYEICTWKVRSDCFLGRGCAMWSYSPCRAAGPSWGDLAHFPASRGHIAQLVSKFKMLPPLPPNLNSWELSHPTAKLDKFWGVSWPLYRQF